MKWRANLSVIGWRVELFDGETVLIAIGPNQFGAVKSYSRSSPHGFNPGFEVIWDNCKLARKAYPPAGRSGRYGSRSSQTRGEFCVVLAAALNSARVFPTPSVSEE